MNPILSDKIIVGGMLVSRDADMLDITIPNLLKWCDWAVILMDNESQDVVERVKEYSKKYYDRLWVRRTSIPHDIVARSGEILSYHNRWKAVKGIVRDEMFVNLKRILKLGQRGFDRIDIFIWPDSDEIFTDYLPELIKKFDSSDYKAIKMKPIDVVGDLKTVMVTDMQHHVHIMKYSEQLAGLPRRFHAMYYPLKNNEVMSATYYSIHLAHLTKEHNMFRNDNWKSFNPIGTSIWSLPHSAEQVTPDQIIKLLTKEPDGTFGGYD